MTETFSVLIAIGIVMIFVVICVLCAMYLMKNRIYVSDEHFGKLMPNEKAYDLRNLSNKDREEIKKGLEQHNKEARILGEISEEDKLRKEANARYLKSKATVKISEISEVFYKLYPEYSKVNVKYAIMKIINYGNNIDKMEEVVHYGFKPPKLKKVGKTFHINIKTALAMRQVIPIIKHNRKADIYNRKVLSSIMSITLDLLAKKIVPEKDKFLWKNNLADSLDRW